MCKLSFSREKWVIHVSYQPITDEDIINEDWYDVPKNTEHSTKNKTDILLLCLWNFVQNVFLTDLCLSSYLLVVYQQWSTDSVRPSSVVMVAVCNVTALQWRLLSVLQKVLQRWQYASQLITKLWYGPLQLILDTQEAKFIATVA